MTDHITPADVAAMYGISRSTVYRAIQERKLKAMQLRNYRGKPGLRLEAGTPAEASAERADANRVRTQTRTCPPQTGTESYTVRTPRQEGMEGSMNAFISEQKPFAVLESEMGDAQTELEREIKKICAKLEQKQILLECIKDTRKHYMEMAQNG